MTWVSEDIGAVLKERLSSQGKGGYPDDMTAIQQCDKVVGTHSEMSTSSSSLIKNGRTV